MKKILKKIIDKTINDKRKKKASYSYWWNLREKASGKGLSAYLKKQKYNKYMEKYNAFIPLKTIFKSIPVFPHGVCGVFISSGAEIGNNCTIFHQVTIGSNTLADSAKKGAPTIGDNVYIGCGAKIIGNVCIGDNVRIGANCVVTSDIPSNCTVVLEKPRVIQKDNNVNNFVLFTNLEK